jgi:hypothetical protein
MIVMAGVLVAAGPKKVSNPELERNRVVAAEAYVIYKNNKEQGLTYFDENTTGGYGKGGNKLKLMQRHYENIMLHRDKLQLGRPCKLPDEAVYAAMQALLAGYTVELPSGTSLKRGFSSLTDALRSGTSPSLAYASRLLLLCCIVSGLHLTHVRIPCLSMHLTTAATVHRVTCFPHASFHNSCCLLDTSNSAGIT